MSYVYRLVDSGRDPEYDEALFQTVLEIDHEGPKPRSLAIDFKEVEKGVTPVSISEKERDPDWRDKPKRERGAIYWKEGKAERKRELQEIWASFKKDPLDPVRGYVKRYVVTGIGMLLEGWIIISISNNRVLFKQTYRECWGDQQPVHCNNTSLQATTYVQLIGILLGQLFFGFCGDWIGRKKSMLGDLMIVLLGVIMLTVSNGVTEQGWIIMFLIAQFTFGFGIGGEYPATSTRATEEESETDRERSQRHRGRTVMLAYTMQGWGQLLNLGMLLISLLIFNSSGNPPYSHAASGATWRLSFAILIPVIIYFIYYRIYVLQELKAYEELKKKNQVTGYDWKSFRALRRHFWHRLVGSCGCWFANDWYFYGSTVFRSELVNIFFGYTVSAEMNWLWGLMNAGIQLCGYYAAALTVDWRPWGRRRMTIVSFLVTTIIFLIIYVAYDTLVEKPNLKWFQVLYYLASFVALFGSHTTSFLLSAEMFPSAIRSTSHGISAATGKLGAVTVTAWFNYVSPRNRFLISFPVAFVGALVAYVFVADMTGLDLAEQDLRWTFVRAGKAGDYHGPAVHPRHLSLYEKRVLKVHHQYDPELHARQSAVITKSFQKKMEEGRTMSRTLSQRMAQRENGEELPSQKARKERA